MEKKPTKRKNKQVVIKQFYVTLSWERGDTWWLIHCQGILSSCFYGVCCCYMVTRHDTCSVCKLGSIFILFVGIMNKSAFFFFYTLLTVRYAGKENSSKQHDAICNTNVTKDASGASKFLILRSILKYIFKSLKLSICRKKWKMGYESWVLHYDSGLESWFVERKAQA